MVSETELMRELAVLRSSVAQLERAVRRRYRVTLEAAYDQPFLGQAATLFVTVRDELTQQPVADAPVTFVTSWGTLRTVAQLRGQTGTSVITQTGVDGTARVTLRPEVAQWLHSEQQAVLEAFVHELDATAPSPQAVLPTLQQMVGEYRWEPNLQLRQAVDSYFAAHRHQLVDPVNQRNELAAWATINATISVTVHEVLPVDADGNQHVGEIAGMALQTLHFRNWLAPWLQVYLETLQSEANFLDTLADAGAAGDAGELLGRAYRSIERYVGKQFGRVGEYTGQQVAKRAVQEFLSTTIAKLPTDTQANLFPALKVASRTVTQEGIHVLTALAQTRTDLREELQHDAGGIDRTQFADLVKRLAGVETDVNRQLGALNERFRTVDNRFGEFERELNDSLSTVVRVDEIDSIRNQLTDLSRRIGEFRGTFSDRLATLEGDNERLRTNLEGFGRTLTTLQQNVRGLEGSLDERLAAKIDTGTFNDFQNQINQALRGKVNVITHTQLRAEFTKGLAALQEAASRIDNDLLTLRRRVDERFPRP